MSEEKPAEDNQAENGQPTQKSGMKKLLMVLVPVVLLIGSGAAAFMMMGGDDKAAQTTQQQSDGKKALEPLKKSPVYVTLAEDFLVNLTSKDNKKHHLRIAVTIMTRDTKYAEILKLNEPLLKNDLLTLFQVQSFEGLLTTKGKVDLRQAALESIRKSAEGLQGEGNIESVLFTKFIME